MPVDGQDQPFRIVRPGIQRISSTVMATQQEGSLYYADFLFYGLGSDDIFNLPHGTRFEAVFGTYFSEGYRYETEDTRLTFSSFETVRLHFTPAVLPVGAEDDFVSRLPIDGQRIDVRYSWAPLVAQIQRFVSSQQERVVCADPLVRHYLPTYIAVDISYRGGAEPSALYEDIAALIDSIDPASDALAVSEVENVVRQGGSTDWTHPIELVAVTHDLDRRVVADRSIDRLGGTLDVPFNGSVRTSFFIPGVDESKQGEDEQGQPAEKIQLTREVAPVLLR
jgi:hypothetical protein